MENREQINLQEPKILGILDSYLNARGIGDHAITTQDSHLDEDSLAAFTEGNLNTREAQPIISHLVKCSFCRHITAELVRLDLAFAEDDSVAQIIENREPSRVSEVLSGLLSRIFGTSDGAVFAHHEEEDGNEKNNTEKSEKAN